MRKTISSSIILMCALFFGCATLLIGSALAKGFKPGTEPDNFRGIRWGQNIDSLPEMKFLNEVAEGIKYYTRENDKLMIGDASLSRLYYIFYKDRFCSVQIIFPRMVNFDKIKITLFSTYGEGEKSNEFIEEFRWRGPNVRVVLKYSEITEEGTIVWFYVPIMMERDRNEKERAKEGVEDL